MLDIRSDKKIALLATGLLLLLLGGTLPTVSAMPRDQRVTVFTGPNGGWFGFSVAMGKDAVFVGSPTETAGVCALAGRVYVYTTTGSLVSTINSPNAQCGGFFGSSVAVDDSRVVVGASGEGHAYIFSNTGSLIATLPSPGTRGSGGFGSSVAVSGSTVVVGAPHETASGFGDAGRAYIFNSAGSLIATLTSPNPQIPRITGGHFGSSVAASSTSIVVGAPLENQGEFESAGRAYIFSTTGSLMVNLTSPNRQYNGLFGFSVSASDASVVVGAFETLFELHGPIRGAGRAYVFNNAGFLVATLTSPNKQDYGSFGGSVAVSRTRIVVGALTENAGRFDGAGNAYVFSITGSLIANLTSPDPRPSESLGFSVAVSGIRTIVGDLVGHVYLFTVHKAHT